MRTPAEHQIAALSPGLPTAGLASRPYPGPRPEVGGYGRGVPSGWCLGHRRDWRAVARTAQRPALILDATGDPGLPPCWRYGFPAASGGKPMVYSPTLSIRQYLPGPTVGVLWGGQDQGRHDQMLLRRQRTAKSRMADRDREYLRWQGEASGGVPGGWFGDRPSCHRFRQRAIDTATDGRAGFPRGEHGLRSRT